MVSIAPIQNPIDMEDPAWVRHMTDVADLLGAPNWDSGAFTPVFTSLTESDSTKITKTGTFVRHGQILYFDVVISTTGGATTTSIFGTTFFLLPSLLQAGGGNRDKITAKGYGMLSVMDIGSPVFRGEGYVDINTLKAFVPVWSTGSKLSITGWVRTQGL